MIPELKNKESIGAAGEKQETVASLRDLPSHFVFFFLCEWSRERGRPGSHLLLFSSFPASSTIRLRRRSLWSPPRSTAIRPPILPLADRIPLDLQPQVKSVAFRSPYADDRHMSLERIIGLQICNSTDEQYGGRWCGVGF